MRHEKKALFLLGLALATAWIPLPGCQPGGTPGAEIPEDKLAEAFAQKLILQEEVNLKGVDSLAAAGRLDSIYSALGLARPEVDTAIARRGRGDLEAWKHFYEKVVRHLEEHSRQAP